ncbi:MAG: hypothetical protein Tsb0014_36980 [Pleurocapsa sp.]
MYVYQTPVFEEQVGRHEQLVSKVQRLYQELEGMNEDDVQTRFGRLYPYLKRKEGNFRLIARIVSVNRDRVLCWLRVFARGDREYQDFLRDREDYADRALEKEINLSILSQWLQKRKAELQNVKNSPRILPPHLRIWLQRPRWEIEPDRSIIYESDIWFTKFRSAKIRDRAIVFHQIIERLVQEFGSLGHNTQWSEIKIYGNNNSYILYSPLVTVDIPSRQVLFLLAPFNYFPEDEEIEAIINSLSLQGNEYWWQNRQYLTVDNLISFAKRAYPSYLLAEYDFWLAIEDGNGVNLALSTEEKEILHRVSTQESLPLFLNGRAGSGKSTMLYYLFTDYCDRYLQFSARESKILPKPHPLFLTYNQKLSDLAKDKVQSLLKYNYRFLAQNELHDIPDIGTFFKSLRPFLINLLPQNKKLKFQEDNYVSFYRFRQLCTIRGRNYCPEKSWQVIRTFIKGYYWEKSKNYSNIQDYKNIPKKEKTVSESEFAEIYRKVWKWYFEYSQKHQLWDDQDLIRTVLQNKYYRSEYTAVFCDEAQDFTRIELQLIMRLSIFSRYNLAQEKIMSLPFAFAGDPLQTLNPTGFRWESLKSAFHNEILTNLTVKSQFTSGMNFQELQYNYRSVAPLVRFNNLIQLWRKNLFSLANIKPQKSRKYSQFLPKKFIFNYSYNNLHGYNLIKILSNILIIIPCDEGGEIDFIRQDELLSQLPTTNQSETPWNILSAIAAKGLEFKQVVLYKFGDFCPPDLWHFKNELSAEEKYFLNKLYVAASRATEKLFVVDSKLGDERLWQKASEPQLVAEFITKLSLTEQNQWKQNIQLIINSEYPEQMSNDDPETIALTFELEGIKNENPELLKKARTAYQHQGNKEKADFCWAWQLKLEQQFVAAGKEFLQLNNLAAAYECFWQGLAWQELSQLNLQSPRVQVENLIDELVNCNRALPLIEFMVSSNASPETVNIPNLLEFTSFLLAEIQQYNITTYPYSKQWQVAIQTYQQQVTKVILYPSVLTTQNWQDIGSILDIFLIEEQTDIGYIAAQCFYHGKNYHRAAQSWEKVASFNDTKLTFQEYYLAKAKITKFPENLTYLFQGNCYREIIELWIESGRKRDPIWLKYVASALETLERIEDAFAVYCYLNHYDKVQLCWQKIQQKSNYTKQLKNLLNYYLHHQHWQQAISLIKAYLTTQIKQTPLKYYFIHRLASSQLTLNVIERSIRQKYQQFIEQEILNNSRWQKYLSVVQMGATLEKIGSFSQTLRFYENYIHHPDFQLCQFARYRWLATKQKQVNYFNSLEKTDKAQNNNRELMAQANQWQINLKNIILQPPSPSQKIVPFVTQNSVKISGLSVNTLCKTLANGVQQFKLRHLIFKIFSQTQQILIRDLIHHQTIRLNTRLHQIQIGTAIVTTDGNQPLIFRQTKYTILLTNFPHPSVEFNLHQYSEKILIEFDI